MIALPGRDWQWSQYACDNLGDANRSLDGTSNPTCGTLNPTARQARNANAAKSERVGRRPVLNSQLKYRKQPHAK